MDLRIFHETEFVSLFILMYLSVNVHIQFFAKNLRFVVTKSVKLSDEFGIQKIDNCAKVTYQYSDSHHS